MTPKLRRELLLLKLTNRALDRALPELSPEKSRPRPTLLARMLARVKWAAVNLALRAVPALTRLPRAVAWWRSSKWSNAWTPASWADRRSQ